MPVTSWCSSFARGRSPSSSAFSSLIQSTAAAPSEICDDEPAVCFEPSTTGLSFASPSIVVSRRPWSREISCVSPVG